jgi:D-psicose/D-tagatose/L-ribulose 3-epimerase
MSETVYEMGGTFLSGILHGVWPHIVDTVLDDKTDFLKYSAESVAEAAQAVESLGITLNLEIVNRFEQFLINTADEGLAFIKQVGRPNIKLLLDIFHMNIEEDSISDALRRTGPLLGHVHMSENNRMPPHPHGHMNWEAIIDDLKAIHYEGVLVMEPFVQMGGEVGMALRIWRNLVNRTDEASLDQLVSDSLKYIRSLIDG